MPISTETSQPSGGVVETDWGAHWGREPTHSASVLGWGRYLMMGSLSTFTMQ